MESSPRSQEDDQSGSPPAAQREHEPRFRQSAAYRGIEPATTNGHKDVAKARNAGKLAPETLNAFHSLRTIAIRRDNERSAIGGGELLKPG